MFVHRLSPQPLDARRGGPRAEHLRALRHQAGLSVYVCAKVLKLPVAQVTRLETGKAALSEPEWLSVVTFLDSIVPAPRAA